MAHSGEPSGDRPSIPLRIWRVIVVLLLILVLLLVLAYCLVQVRDNEAAAPTATGAPTTTDQVETTADTTTDAGGGATPSGRRTAGQSGAAPIPRSTGPTASSAGPTASSPGTSATRRPTPTHTGTPPRAAPNTGGGSAAGAPDLWMVMTGTLLLIASIGLGLFTARRWRRTW